VTDEGSDRRVDPIEQELFVGTTLAESDAQSRRDLSAFLTAALFGAIDDASTDIEARDTSER